jgi:oxalate decarboxylase
MRTKQQRNGISARPAVAVQPGNDGRPAEPIRGDRGASIMGPRNIPLERENPDMLASPDTDAGTTPNLKYSFANARNRLAPGGWAREVTVRELPISTTMAGVNMRLKPGGIRELHWHKEAEWAYMLAGRARITAVDARGRNFIEDVGVGDLWNFPAGIPHSIQGLEEGCEFLLVFDNGEFSENETFLISDWFVHTPNSVLAKNFGVPASSFSDLPQDIERTHWILSGEVPGPLAADKVVSPAGVVPTSYAYFLSKEKPIKVAGGQVRIVDSSNFPASSTIAAALVEVDPGGMRELHWHPNVDEWQYYISGQGKMTVFASAGKARTFDYQAGDVGYIPFAMGHYIENTGDEPLRFLEMFRSSYYADVSLTQWLALLPPELVLAHMRLDQRTMAGLRKDKPIIVK